MPDNRPIGIFDSGLGGVTVLKVAKKQLQNESFIYFGDNANAPYGIKTMDEIQTLSVVCAEKLIEKNVKAILIACNTATSAAIDIIRSRYSLPLISMEPAIKPAIVACSDEGRVLMMATPATCGLQRYIDLREKLDVKKQVIDVKCAGLVDVIEQNAGNPQAAKQIIQGLLAPYQGMTIDGIVLGCTHFSCVQQQIENFAQEHFNGKHQIFDGRFGTVKHLKNVLKKNDLCAFPENKQTIELLTSGKEELILPAMYAILNA